MYMLFNRIKQSKPDFDLLIKKCPLIQQNKPRQPRHPIPASLSQARQSMQLFCWQYWPRSGCFAAATDAFAGPNRAPGAELFWSWDRASATKRDYYSHSNTSHTQKATIALPRTLSVPLLRRLLKIWSNFKLILINAVLVWNLSASIFMLNY